MAVRDLIEDAGLTFAKPEARKAFIRSLIPLTESERKELITERRGKQHVQQPKSQPAGGTKPVTEAEKFTDTVEGRMGVLLN
jgi:hypothetical protein